MAMTSPKSSNSVLSQGIRVERGALVCKSVIFAEVKIGEGARITGGTETILVADDELIVREYLKSLLENAGYRINYLRLPLPDFTD
jgi:ADP-glucose pyrophosphorylase